MNPTKTKDPVRASATEGGSPVPGIRVRDTLRPGRIAGKKGAKATARSNRKTFWCAGPAFSEPAPKKP